MKRILMGIALVPCMAFATLDDGLVAHYMFDGNTHDSSGNGYNLTVWGQTIYTHNKDGRTNSAFRLSETYLNATDKTGMPLLNVTNYCSFVCWFRTDQNTELKEESLTGIYGADPDIRYLYHGCNGGVSVGNNGINVFECGSYWFPATVRYDANFAGEWHQLAVVCNGNDVGMQLYVDGELVRIGLVSHRGKQIYVVGGETAGLGRAGYGDFFNGDIDDVRIYNRAITAEEVKALYDGYLWSYDINDGEARVTGLESVDPATPISGAMVVPSMLGGFPVVAIDGNALKGCTNMTSVTIPASVKTIGDSAFEGCRSLADVYFEGDTMSAIGVDAFRGCYWDLIMHVPTTWKGRGRTICGYTVWKGSMFIVK